MDASRDASTNMSTDSSTDASSAAPLPPQLRLTSLHLSNTGGRVGPDGGEAVARWLCAAAAAGLPIADVGLQGFIVGVAGVECLAQFLRGGGGGGGGGAGEAGDIDGEGSAGGGRSGGGGRRRRVDGGGGEAGNTHSGDKREPPSSVSHLEDSLSGR